MMALRAAAAAARALALTPLILGDALEGESRELGIVLAGIARAVRSHGTPLAAPALLLSGGETTVTIGAGPAGRGGRNSEFLLGLAVALAGTENIWAAAGDTDGIDGSEDAAGAIATPDTLARARAKNLDPRGIARRPRQLHAVRRPRRPDRHRADADQRERFPRRPDRLTPKERR